MSNNTGMSFFLNEHNSKEKDHKITELALKVIKPTLGDVEIEAFLYKGNDFSNTLNVVIKYKEERMFFALNLCLSVIKIFSEELENIGFEFYNGHNLEKWEILFYPQYNQILLKNFLNKSEQDMKILLQHIINTSTEQQIIQLAKKKLKLLNSK